MCWSAEQKSVDEQFIDSLQNGLMARWEANDENYGDTTENWTTYLNAELKNISKYKDMDFEDKDLKEKAVAYIGTLEDAMELVDYVDTDYNRFWQSYEPILDNRNVYLSEINEIIPLEFSNKDDKQNFQGLLDDAEITSGVKALVQSIQFQPTTVDDYGDSYYATLSATVENNLKHDFDYLQMNINFVDENGVIVESTYSGCNQWRSKEKHLFEVYTSHRYSTMQIVQVDYSVDNSSVYGSIYLGE